MNSVKWDVLANSLPQLYADVPHAYETNSENLYPHDEDAKVFYGNNPLDEKNNQEMVIPALDLHHPDTSMYHIEPHSSLYADPASNRFVPEESLIS